MGNLFYCLFFTFTYSSLLFAADAEVYSMGTTPEGKGIYGYAVPKNDCFILAADGRSLHWFDGSYILMNINSPSVPIMSGMEKNKLEHNLVSNNVSFEKISIDKWIIHCGSDVYVIFKNEILVGFAIDFKLQHMLKNMH
jgi:hypothetical protein